MALRLNDKRIKRTGTPFHQVFSAMNPTFSLSTSLWRVVGLVLATLFLISCGDIEINSNIYHGDSITYECARLGYVNGLSRAVGGYTSYEVLKEVIDNNKEESNHHILVGINDFHLNIEDSYLYRMDLILTLLRGNVVVTSILPTDESYISNDNVKEMNKALENLVLMHGHIYNDKWAEFEVYGVLNSAYTGDGIHLNAKGCEVLFD
jgi:hypothetical protein